MDPATLSMVEKAGSLGVVLIYFHLVFRPILERMTVAFESHAKADEIAHARTLEAVRQTMSRSATAAALLFAFVLNGCCSGKAHDAATALRDDLSKLHQHPRPAEGVVKEPWDKAWDGARRNADALEERTR